MGIKITKKTLPANPGTKARKKRAQSYTNQGQPRRGSRMTTRPQPSSKFRDI